jgi:peptidoglycan/LPS O-acetylase OafA/YrhL
VTRNTQLDGLRACAAFAVAVYHTILAFDPSQVQRILSIDIWSISGLYDKIDKVVLAVVNGQTAVVIFFVLSGAVLFNSLERHRDGPLITSFDFVVRRCFRIYPVLIVSLLAFAIVVVCMGGRPSGRQLWTNALLLDNPIQGESWTLQVEFLAIPFILLSFYCHRVAGTGGIVAAYLSIWLLFKTPWLSPYLGHPRFYTLCFVLGFLSTTSAGAWVATQFPVRAWPLVLIVMLGARHVIPVRIFATDIDPIAIGLLFTSAGLLVTLLYYGRAGRLGLFLQLPVLAYLGRLSYSFYLYNIIIIRILCSVLVRHTSAKEHPLEFGLVTAAVIIAITVPIAHLSEKYIERPFIELGGRVARIWIKPLCDGTPLAGVSRRWP